MKLSLILVLFSLSMTAFAAPDASEATANPDAKIKYKAGKELNFEQLVIEGALKRPEMAIVTGDSDENGNGLLRLRENFQDRLTESAGKEVQ